MQVRPASIDQVQRAKDGRMVLISARESTIAADLQRIDRRLKLRFSEGGGYWAVFEQPEGGCPCPDPNCEHGHLVLTAQECDDRIVQRIQYIDPQGRGGYSYADALEKATLDAHRKSRQEFLDHVEELGEQAAHAVRRDLGARYKGGIQVPREI
jgi:hypothetical protein